MDGSEEYQDFVGKRIIYTALTFISSYMAGRMAEETLENTEKQTPLNWFLVFSTVGVNLMFLWNLWYQATRSSRRAKVTWKARRSNQPFGISGINR